VTATFHGTTARAAKATAANGGYVNGSQTSRSLVQAVAVQHGRAAHPVDLQVDKMGLAARG